jgi:hypothetical protein
MAANWNHVKYSEWIGNTHIPEDVMSIVNAVCEKIGICVQEEVVFYRNRWGKPYASAKGFHISHCTSSYETGPTTDMVPVFIKWLGGLGFEVCASYGDNGMDSATNWHDTYWSTDIAYTPTIVSDEVFYDWDDEEDEDDDDYGYDGCHCSDGYNWRTGEWD